MFKRGDIVIKVIVGGGCKTASIQRVKGVSKGVVTLVGAETLSWRNSDGMEIDPAIRGFYSEIIPLDGDEEDKILGDRVPSR